MKLGDLKSVICCGLKIIDHRTCKEYRDVYVGGFIFESLSDYEVMVIRGDEEGYLVIGVE